MPTPHRVSLALAFLLVATPALRAVQPGLRVYADDLVGVPLQSVLTGINAENVPLSALTTSGAASAAALEALTSWNFTPAGALPGTTDKITQQAPLTSAWTCYLPDTTSCGFGWPGNDVLSVTDGITEGRVVRSATAYEYDAAGGKIVGRASVIDEGGADEVRLCVDPSQGRPEVALAHFPHVDGPRRYFTAGDPSWSSPEFDCVPAATQGGACGSGGTTGLLDAGTGTTGKVTSRIVRAGTVTLPSGHVIDAILIESLASYTVRIGSCPGFLSVTIRTWGLTWIAPGLGVIASITSGEDVASLAAFTTARSTFIGFGLLPPISIQQTSITSSQVAVSWNPGAITRFIDGWEVHWGTQPGAVVAPPFTSGALPAAQTSYTITGLAPSTSYWISVTSRRSYRDPRSGVTTAYQSIALPKSTGADANGNGVRETSYPPEIGVTTLAPGACVKGDIFPSGVGDLAVTLGDFVTGRGKILNPGTQNARDTTCGDVAPGTITCSPAGLAQNWCVGGDAAFGLGDLVIVRRLAAHVLSVSCASCAAPETGGSATGEQLRRPGDIAPRGDSDGTVDIADVVLALRMAVLVETPSAEELVRADIAPFTQAGGLTIVTGNDAIDVSDVVVLLRASVGLETLAWPERRIAVRLADSVDYVAFTATTANWPAWADVIGFQAPDCSSASALDGGSGLWAITCDVNAQRRGPEDLASYVYRAPEAVLPGSLDFAWSEVAAPDYSPIAGVTLTLEAR